MARKKTKKRGEAKGKSHFQRHVVHKSKLTYLLITKLLVALLCFAIGIVIYSIFNDATGDIIAAIMGFAAACAAYLFIIIRILHALRIDSSMADDKP